MNDVTQLKSRSQYYNISVVILLNSGNSAVKNISKQPKVHKVTNRILYREEAYRNKPWMLNTKPNINGTRLKSGVDLI